MACPAIQTSGGTSFIPELQERTFPYLFSPAANEAPGASDLSVAPGTEVGELMHYGRTRGATVIFQWTYSQTKPRDVIWNQNSAASGNGSAVCRRRRGRRGREAAGHAADE